jgi:hypothetical protein
MSEELSAEARALIRGGIAQESPVGPSRRARMKHSLLVKALLVAPRTVEAAQVAASGGSLSSEMAFSKLAIWAAKGAGAGVLVAVTTYGVARVAPMPMPVPVPVPVNLVNQQGHNAKVAENEELARAVDVAASPPATAAPASSQRVAPASASALPSASSTVSRSLSAELLLMAEVQRALRDGRPAQALELVGRHAAEFPDGQLMNERLAAEAFAACQSGDVARSRRAAARFLERDSTSSLASRVRKTCPPDGR